MPKHPRIKPVQDSKHWFLGLYGIPSVGKTRLLGTQPNTLIIRPPTEHTDSIRDPKNVEEWVVNGWNDMNEVLEYARHEGKNHSLIALDSASLFQDTGLDEIWEDVIAAKPHRAQYGLDKGEYGVNMTRLARWVRHMVSMDEFNFAFTAHPYHYEVPATGEEILMPYVQGKMMPEKLCGYMNIVLYYELAHVGKGDDKKVVRVLRSRPTPDYYAKDQFDCLENGRMVNPTMPKLVAAIDAARASGRKPAVARRRKRVRKSTIKRRRTA